MQIGLTADLSKTDKCATLTSTPWGRKYSIPWSIVPKALISNFFKAIRDEVDWTMSTVLNSMADEHPLGEFVHFSADFSRLDRPSWAVCTLTSSYFDPY
jgi:hypothetical protein